MTCQENAPDFLSPMLCTHLFNNFVIRNVPKVGEKKYRREKLSASPFLSPWTYDLVDFTSARSMYSTFSNIYCWPSIDAVDELLNQPSKGVLSLFAL